MRDKVDQLGAMFRLITPVMIAIIGFFGVKYLNSIDTRFLSIDNKFDTFISTYHLMDKRVDRLEYKVFGSLEKEK